MRYIIAIAAAWVAAQSLKHAARLAGRNRRVFGGSSPTLLLLSGGMPSAHAAGVASLTTMIGLIEGVDSSLFALSALFASIVIYDAVMVRYSSGQQGELLNQLVRETKSKLSPVRVAHGHTVIEVAAGACVGVIVAVIVFFTTL